MKSFKLKPTINKTNGQINISLPKKKLPKEMQDNFAKLKSVKFNLEDFEFE